MPDNYLQLIVLPIVFFSMEFAQTKVAMQHTKKLGLFFIAFSILSGFLFWLAEFSPQFILIGF